MSNSLKHRHRRTTSTTLSQPHQNSSTFSQYAHANMSMSSKEILTCLEDITINTSRKSVFVEQLEGKSAHVSENKQKSKKDLKQIENDLRGWSAFEEDFIKNRIIKMRMQNLRKKRDEILYCRYRVYAKNQNIPFQILNPSLKKIERKRNLRI